MKHAGPALQPMHDLLVLAERLPWPAGQDPTLRACNIVKFLSTRYRVHLGCFHDPRSEPAQLGKLRALCYETCFVPQPGLSARMRSLGAAAGGRPAALPYYRNRTLAAWAGRLLQRQPVAAALALSAPMAQYLSHGAGPRKVLDLSTCGAWPLAALPGQAAAQLAYRRTLLHNFDGTVFDSVSIPNGVDADYFSPHIVHRSPFPPGVEALVSDCRDDIEAAEWFAQAVFAPLQARRPALRWYLLGADRDRRLLALARRPGVVAGAALADPRPALAHAALVVAPGRGKLVLEAMALQKIVLASSHAAEAIGARAGTELLAARGRDEFIGHILAALSNPDPRPMALAARARVLADWRWSDRLELLCTLLDGGAREAAA